MNAHTLSKTAAIKTARKAIGHPIGHGTSWSIYGPYTSSPDGLRGPSTEVHADSYWSARAKRAQWVAYLALRLMGWTGEDADFAAYGGSGYVSDIDGLIRNARR